MLMQLPLAVRVFTAASGLPPAAPGGATLLPQRLHPVGAGPLS